jgi:hypothetical protein
MDDWAMAVVDAAHDVKAGFDRVDEGLRGGRRGACEKEEERAE